MWPGRRWKVLLSALLVPACTAFLVPQPSAPLRARVGPLMDASMVTDFALNDTVRVKPGIILDARDWSGMVGRVTSLWSKCDTDPACCCAELSTEGAIRVEFSDDSSYQFFAENEIEKV